MAEDYSKCIATVHQNRTSMHVHHVRSTFSTREDSVGSFCRNRTWSAPMIEEPHFWHPNKFDETPGFQDVQRPYSGRGLQSQICDYYKRRRYKGSVYHLMLTKYWSNWENELWKKISPKTDEHRLQTWTCRLQHDTAAWRVLPVRLLDSAAVAAAMSPDCQERLSSVQVPNLIRCPMVLIKCISALYM